VPCKYKPRRQYVEHISVEGSSFSGDNPAGGHVEDITFWVNSRGNNMPDITYFDCYGTNWSYGQVYPSLWFIEEISSYPQNKYNFVNHIFCYPLGSYDEISLQVLIDKNYPIAFCNYKGIFDHRPYASINVSDTFMEVPRTFVGLATPDFRDTIPHLSTELYRKNFLHFPNSKFYAYIIHQPDTWISSTKAAMARIDDIDVAIFDGIEIGEKVNGEYDLHINIDWDLLDYYQQKKKYCLLLFGGYEFNADYEHAIFADKQGSIDLIMDYLETYHFDGVSLDFEEVYPEDREIATEWFEELAARCHTDEKYYEIHVAAPYPFANYSEEPIGMVGLIIRVYQQ